MTFAPLTAAPQSVVFYLSPHVAIDAVSINDRAVAVGRRPPHLPLDPFLRQRYADFDHLQRYEALPPIAMAPDQSLVVTVRYHGEWPSTSETTASSHDASVEDGVIDPQGLSLSGQSGWYPLWPDALFTFELEVDHPADWEALGAGRLTAHRNEGDRTRTIWSMDQAAESIDLFAGPYVVTTRSIDGITLSTYFYREDASLADEYLDAAAADLQRDIRLLGPYRFPKFVIAESRFPVGEAYPSFALLGQSILKRHYTQPYALGHEIVHQWFGTGVIPDEAQGNWAEALTTYLSNYYAVEEDEGEEAARQARQKMLVQYTVLVDPGHDYPLMRFLTNSGPIDSAIGYQKGAFVFHQLRRLMGDDAFFGALREFTDRYGGKRAGWNDLRLVAEGRMDQSLDWFFRQWIVRGGAPTLEIERVELSPLTAEAGEPNGTQVSVHLRQSSPPFRLPVTVHIETEDRILEKSLWMDQPEAVVETAVAKPPIRISVDPGVNLFRRLAGDELPPMLNRSVSDPALQIVLPDGAAPGLAVLYRAIADRVNARRGTLAMAPAQVGTPATADTALLLFGGPAENTLTAELARRLPPGIAIGPNSFTIAGRQYHDATQALFLTIHDADRGNRSTTLFYGLSADAVAPLVPRLLYHGWDSYIVFDHGTATTTATLPAPRSRLTWSPPARPPGAPP